MNNVRHIRKEIPAIERVSIDGTRFYKTPEGNLYPSVTSVLSILSKESIDEWKAAVGEEEAFKVSRRASIRGTIIHEHCEDWLNNKDVEPSMFHKEIWDSMLPDLNDINDIMGLEIMMWSDKLKMAGTADVIGYYKGKLSIIDFKTSRKLKNKKDISSYFIQGAIYSLMFLERTGILVKDIVIIIGVDNEGEPQIFKEKVVDWLPKAVEVRKEYQKLFGV